MPSLRFQLFAAPCLGKSYVLPDRILPSRSGTSFAELELVRLSLILKPFTSPGYLTTQGPFGTPT